MKNLSLPLSYSVRHALSVGIAILLAVMTNDYLSYTQSGWVILSALLVSQTTRGTPVRQGASFFLVIMIAVLFAFITQLYLSSWQALLVVLLIYMASGMLLAEVPMRASNHFYFLVFFIIMTMIALLSPAASTELIRYQVADVMMGAGIGLGCALLIFPVKPEQEFYQGLLPVLTSLIDYARTFESVFAKNGENNRLLLDKRHAMEKVLQDDRSLYPEWVYEGGFNPGLRAGYRFYLIYLERVTELFFAMDGMLTRGMDRAMLNDLSSCLIEVMKNNQMLLTALHGYFQRQEMKEITMDLTSDVKLLEEKLRTLVPQKLELLDISPECVEATALVRDMKDSRELLLKLAMALPNEASSPACGRGLR